IDEFFSKSHKKMSSQNWEDRIIMVTSGSTATPKIICHNGHSICSQIELTGDIVKINPTIKHDRKLNVRILAFLPFYHVFGLVSTMMWFTFFGRTLIFLPNYNPNTIQEVCRNQNVSHFFATPLVWDKVVKNLLKEVETQGKTDLFNKMINFSNKLQTVFPHIGASIIRNTVFKSVRKQALGTNLHFLISGGGFISPETLRVLNGLGYSLYNGYGLTECGILSVNLSRKAEDRLTTNCGPLFSNVDYRINENSQLEITNNNTFIGTYKNGDFIEFTEEFINTNDIVELDSKNRLKVIGRNDDVIVTSGGENLSPEAIEEKLDTSDFETATILYGKINSKEQLILALSYSSNNSALYLANALDKLYKSIEKLPLIERPTAVIRIIDEIPFNLKSVDRKELKSRIDSNSIFYEACSVSATENMAHYEDKEYREIINTVKNVFAKVTNTPVENITDTVDFVNAGGDSLGYFELIAEIKEQTGVEIDTESNILLTPMSFANYIYQHKESK
ncbi:MAG: AMP-binding protein, partial [Ruminococcus sp.]